MKPTLGVCYYPEHWPQSLWAQDAARMVSLNLSWVRIGEFAWQRLQPSEQQFDWGWLDRAIDILGAAGLKIILGTPTAAPPAWMVKKMPGMLAVDFHGRVRKFGARRHYCFSHNGYRQQAQQISKKLAKRYTNNPFIHAWQIDNEYGCHNSIISYSAAAHSEFQSWLMQKYQSIDALNRAWGTVFWSMQYGCFNEIELPNMTVTEPNPAHVFDFYRFSSDQVVSFNRLQVDILRRYSNVDILHNYMGGFSDFDHFAVAKDLDIAAWDSYPLGFLQNMVQDSAEHKHRYAQQGDPDFQAFHHDLYRSVGCGRFWVIEQQPGPVNWADYNPAPLAGMVALWSLEAIAHGGENVCYFRWRQLPFAQEQMHAGLLRTDNQNAAAIDEIKTLTQELQCIGEVNQKPSEVALIFDYSSAWAWKIQPQGKGFTYFNLVFDTYRALRKLGLSIDILPATVSDLSGYKLILAPGLMSAPPPLQKAIAAFDGIAIFGPRYNSKTNNFSIPTSLPPNIDGLDCRVELVETLSPNFTRAIENGGYVKLWQETITGNAKIALKTTDGKAVLMHNDKFYYLGAWFDQKTLKKTLNHIAKNIGIATQILPTGVRIRDTVQYRFVFNYSAKTQIYNGEKINAAQSRYFPLNNSINL